MKNNKCLLSVSAEAFTLFLSVPFNSTVWYYVSVLYLENKISWYLFPDTTLAKSNTLPKFTKDSHFE